MKKNLLFFVLFIAGISASAQPAIKVFAFEQQNLPGTIPAGIKDENGNPIKKAATKKNYFIFLSFKKNCVITPVQVFLKGIPFSVQVTDNKKTPVEYTNNTIPNHPDKTILVPKTNNRVIKIDPIEAQGSENKDPHVEKLTKSNDLVIAYMWKKKKYFVTLKKMKQLDPVANE